MYENEIRSIAEYSIKKLRPLGNTFTFELLSNSDIHPALIQYISAEMEYMIYRERQKLLLESYFDYGDKELIPYFNKIGAIVKKKKELPLEDVSRLIRQAAAMNMNFLLRPKWTLMKLIYNNVDVRTTEEIRILLNYTYFYTYIRKIVGTIFDIKKESSIKQKEFSDLMDNLFEELVASQRRYIVENGIDAMSDFYNIGKGDSTRLPVGMVETFLGEKNLTGQADKLRNVLSPEGDTKFEADVYKDVLFSGTPTAPDSYKPYEPDPSESKLQELELPESNTEEEVIEEITREEEEEPKQKQPEPEETDDEGPPMLEGLKQFSDEFYYNKADDNEETEEEKEPVREKTEQPLEKVKSENAPDRESITMNFLEPEDYEKYLEGDDLDIEYTRVESGIGKEKSEPEKEEAIEDTKEEKTDLEEDHEPEEEPKIEEIDLDEDDKVLKLEDLDLPAEEDEETDIEDITEEIDKETEDEEEVDLTEEEPEEELEDIDSEDIESTVTKPERDTLEEAEMMKDIFGYFDTSETMKVINNFFNEDHVDFVNTMEKIAVADNFDEAEKILDLVYKGAGMSPGSKLSKMLRERVKSYFRERD